MFECGIPATRIGTGVVSVLIFWFIFVFLFVFVFCLRLSFGFIYAYMYNVHLYDIGWDQCNLGSVSGHQFFCLCIFLSSYLSFLSNKGISTYTRVHLIWDQCSTVGHTRVTSHIMCFCYHRQVI